MPCSPFRRRSSLRDREDPSRGTSRALGRRPESMAGTLLRSDLLLHRGRDAGLRQADGARRARRPHPDGTGRDDRRDRRGPRRSRRDEERRRFRGPRRRSRRSLEQLTATGRNPELPLPGALRDLLHLARADTGSRLPDPPRRAWAPAAEWGRKLDAENRGKAHEVSSRYLLGADRNELKNWKPELADEQNWELVRDGLEVKVLSTAWART